MVGNELVGADFSWTKPDPSATATSGYGFVIGCASTDTGKSLSAAQIAAYRATGLQVGLVWEIAADRAMSGATGGATDGAAAEGRADDLGYPTDCVIFFVVDYAASASDFPTLDAYARAFGSATRRPVGVYGPYSVIEHMVGTVVPYGWQTAAWSGGLLSQKAHLYQRSTHTRPAIPGIDPTSYAEDVLLNSAVPLFTSGDDMALTAEDIANIWSYSIAGIQVRDRLLRLDSVRVPALKAQVDAMRAEVDALQARMLTPHGLDGRPADIPDDLLGHVLSTEARVKELAAHVAVLQQNVDAGAMATALAGNPDFLAAIAKAVVDARATRLRSYGSPRAVDRAGGQTAEVASGHEHGGDLGQRDPVLDEVGADTGSGGACAREAAGHALPRPAGDELLDHLPQLEQAQPVSWKAPLSYVETTS